MLREAQRRIFLRPPLLSFPASETRPGIQRVACFALDPRLREDDTKVVLKVLFPGCRVPPRAFGPSQFRESRSIELASLLGGLACLPALGLARRPYARFPSLDPNYGPRPRLSAFPAFAFGRDETNPYSRLAASSSIRPEHHE